MKTVRILPGIFFVLLLVWACGGESKKHQTAAAEQPGAKVTNPNGMSEMSMIMEEWYTRLETYAGQLRSGKQITSFLPLDHEKIYTAEVSREKDNVHGEQFNAFTDAFFYNYDNVGKAASYEEQVSQFNLTVKACINCHEQHCQGPIVRIKKLTVAPAKLE